MPSSASNIRSAWFTTVRVSWRRSRAAQHADLSAHAGAQLSPLADRPTAAWGARRRAASRRHPNLHRQYAAPRALPRACVAAPAAPGLPKSCLWEPCCHLNRHRTSQTAVARYARRRGTLRACTLPARARNAPRNARVTRVRCARRASVCECTAVILCADATDATDAAAVYRGGRAHCIPSLLCACHRTFKPAIARNAPCNAPATRRNAPVTRPQRARYGHTLLVRATLRATLRAT